ncbi:MAG: hypothetical protein L3J22_07245 [Xanthomonadales bacterium]|nr:hypothetical protein [Xanthomonadales bacterium]
MKSKKLILHVGLPKTGSSALQTYLNQHRHALNRFGFNYPADEIDVAMPKHQSLVLGLFQNNHSQLLSFVEKNNSKNLILSTEGLTNHLYDFSLESLSRFRRVIESFDVTIYIVLRSSADWIKSYYTQAVLNPSVGVVDFYATNMKLDEFSEHARIKKLLNKKQLVEDVKQAYGANSVFIGDFEKQWFHDFCIKFELPFFAPALTRINISPSPSMIELMRQINKYKLPENARISWKATIQKYSQSKHTILKRSVVQSELNDNTPLDITILENIYPIDNGWFSLSQDEIDAFRCFVLPKSRYRNAN